MGMIRDLLAEREYKRLRRRLQNLKEGRTEYLSNAVVAINRGLNWPLLTPADQMVLSLLSGPITKAEKEVHIDPVVLDLCIEGVDLLLRHASEAEVAEWATRMRRVMSDVLVPWLRSEDLRILDDWEL